MTSPVSPLATVQDLLRQIERGMLHSEYDWAEVCTRQRQIAREALAVLDSLDGTITLNREEATDIHRRIGRADLNNDAARALLAARIEEAG